ncbi:MAG: FmdB family zinc ribbon protein [Frankia sp.]
MPTYQYRCTTCKNDLEVVQSFTDASLTECPSCAGPLRKVFGNVGVVFKGTGFYKTDSRTAGKSDVAKDRQKDVSATTDSSGSASSSTSSTSSSDSAGSSSSSSSDSSSGGGSGSTASSDSGSSKANAGSSSSSAASAA